MDDLSMTEDSDIRKSAFAAYVAQDLGGPARAIRSYYELVVEQIRELALDHLLSDLEKIGGAAADLNRLIDQMIESGLASRKSWGEDFEATLRHDLRTPLNAIIGYGEMIAEELSDLPHHALSTDIAVVLAEAGALLDRIDAIVDFSRPQTTRSDTPSADQAHSVAARLEAALESEPSRPETAPARILVIDDVASNRDLLARRLGRDGHEVVLAASGSEALVRLEQGDFDVILLDVLMPDMNGIELLTRLKSDEAWRRLPVIMISGLKESDTVIHCVEAGADDYLPKPFNPILLRARINACLERKRSADRERRYLQRIEFERARADSLLHAILPGQVVERLNNGEEVIADRFDSVTILFADLVGFSPEAARMSPTALVQRLDFIFRAFDDLSERHGVEKIKTIGDAYMAAAGLPESADDHAERILRFGCAMLQALSDADPSDVPFRLRVGIHSGPVVAGLIGSHRFIYDVWGETVNIASRLQSQSDPGRIQLSEATRALLTGEWRTESRGIVELKGIGGVLAHLVIR